MIADSIYHAAEVAAVDCCFVVAAVATELSSTEQKFKKLGRYGKKQKLKSFNLIVQSHIFQQLPLRDRSITIKGHISHNRGTDEYKIRIIAKAIYTDHVRLMLENCKGLMGKSPRCAGQQVDEKVIAWKRHQNEGWPLSNN